MSESPPDELMRGRMEQSDFDIVLAWLRKATPEDRVSFLCRWSHIPPLVTRLATSSVNKSAEALTIVVSAFDAITHANSQRTRHWCQFAVTKLGPRKTLRVVRELIVTRPQVVDMACYWSPSMISRVDAAFAELKTMCRDAEVASVIRPPVASVSPTGGTLFHDRYAGTYPNARNDDKVMQRPNNSD